MIATGLIFFSALAMSLLLTPGMIRLGARIGAVDRPDKRKVHTGTISRLGGAAIFLSFHLALLLGFLFISWEGALDLPGRQLLFAAAGGALIFGIGLIDDIRRLNYAVKFVGQILAASLAFWGGLQIEQAAPFGFQMHFGWFAYPLTVFWFLLIINAVNLSDGLDGLAGGIVFFVCLIMIFMLFYRGNPVITAIFAALGGAVLGFLRYNFNPAAIFMGDGGSYFLGYTLAAAAVMCSAKSEMSALFLIPLIALGIPLFDTLFSPIRRFVVGRGAFHPDKKHVHHRLLSMGLSTRKAVLLIYGISILLGLLAIAMVTFRNELRGPFLLVIGVIFFLFIKKLHFFEYVTIEKIYGWLSDVTDVSGISRGRRSFLGLELDIAASGSLEELWRNIQRAVEVIHFDAAEFTLKKGGIELACWEWARSVGDGEMVSDDILEVRLPLTGGSDDYMGLLLIRKDLKRSPLNPHTLRRVEHLRRAIKGVLETFDGNMTP